ncbi:tRNA lysidine(34) synthetase TilS [Martelella alba]|uniref:tRNA(Ile)-lysidine synthase n=1 Tax=Martelella alba TaxID=2590451 RepID=A0ABY2SL64_9HYPH|nr:tRNA lysidine(34) synthetase TilS [Martelella alba]TKI05887.1 tRNA lysidine(34) synthetase TilS [Martelella alba]
MNSEQNGRGTRKGLSNVAEPSAFDPGRAPSADLGEDIRRHVAWRLGARHQLLLAFSGGLDSTVLLDVLADLRQQCPEDGSLRAVYIHHGLSANADAWAEHCRTQCRLRRIPFEVIPVRVSPAAAGIEAGAREARYHALHHALLPGETLLTAQHLDDQCETFLLALKRGSGPTGLSAMAPAMSFHGHELLRPLLGLSRAQLASYANRRRLVWIEDDSNQDDRFDRNFLRLRILPLLKRRWPFFAQSVARSARLCAEQEALLDALLRENLAELTGSDGSLALAPMLEMDALRRGALLRRWLAAAGAAMPTSAQLEIIWREVALSRRDAEPRYQLGDLLLRRFRDRLYIVQQRPSLKSCILPWPDVGNPLVLPDNLGQLRLAASGMAIRPAAADEVITIRFAAVGKQHIVGRDRRREMKKIWQELCVPPWVRERTPLIYFNDQLIAALGRFVTREGQATGDGQTWYIEWAGQRNGDGR